MFPCRGPRWLPASSPAGMFGLRPPLGGAGWPASVGPAAGLGREDKQPADDQQPPGRGQSAGRSLTAVLAEKT